MMMSRRPPALFIRQHARRLILMGALAGPALLASGAAHAQLSLGSGGGAGGGKHDSDADADKKPAPPPAIPGATANAPVAPATKPAAELDPNAALFDAIDRGDMNAAREALNRGADLNAHNILGQRPIDLSIDLSRNDITFLLLSMRAQNGDQAPANESDTEAAAPPDHASDTAAAAPPARHGRHHRHDDTDVAGGQTGKFLVSQPAGTASPQPSAGFLGFGSR